MCARIILNNMQPFNIIYFWQIQYFRAVRKYQNIIEYIFTFFNNISQLVWM